MKYDIRALETTASTNDDAKKAATQGAPEGLVIWALSQSAGRGRHGRQWQSPVGNLYCSVLVRPKGSPRDYGWYSFVAALAISDAIKIFLPDAKLELKWPNDVLLHDKKISGILLEAGHDWLVIGMGVNIKHVPENPLYPVTSLQAERADIPVENVLTQVLEALSRWCAVIENEGFGPIRLAWLARARTGAMRVHMPVGEIQGQFSDVDEEGNLCLLLADGSVRRIHTGDVFFST